jgi:hypothetical protein
MRFLWFILIFLAGTIEMLSQQNASIFVNGDKLFSCNIQNNKLRFSKKQAYKSTAYDSLLTVNGKHSAPKIAMDTSGNEFNNRLYICWSEQKDGVHNKDVFLIFSDDEGVNWTEPLLVTYYPNHKDQYDPQISINKKGELLLCFMDCKNYFYSYKADLIFAKSVNGGLHFDQYKLNSEPLNRKQILGFRFSTNLDSVTLLLKYKKINYCAQTSCAIYSNKVKEIKIDKTFPWSEQLLINFKNEIPLKITASLTKPLDAGFEIYLLNEKKYKSSNNCLLIDFKAKGLKREAYILNLYYNNKTEFVWIIAEEVD